MRLHRCAVAIVLTAGISVPFAGTAMAADRDCADFASQAEAQAALQASPGDPERLDANNNGQACEAFAYTASGSGGGQVSTNPRGGVAAGDGSAAADDEAALPYVLGGLSLVAAGGAAYAARRTARSA
jgi:hypothetical protein